jgi:deoxyribodipyrimidine photo-lyase
MSDRLLSLPELEQYISTIDVKRYAEQRNYLDGSTRLSEYISRGYISLPRIRTLLLLKNSDQAAYKLLNELTWREYWHHTWRIRKNEIFGYFRELNHQPRQGMPTAILEANTGITAIDQGIQQLYDTGYIHNHLRLWIAGIVCNIAKCDWQIGAEWMHSYLIDGDYASNHLSWQWVAGSYTGNRYLPQQDNINTYTRTLQPGTFLDYSYECISTMPIPETLMSLTDYAPRHENQASSSTITIDEMNAAEVLLLYSPWTLDPTWRSAERGLRVLILPSKMYADGRFSQNVLQSIKRFGDSISDLKIIKLSDTQISQITALTILRKDYPGITEWPGVIDTPELLYPNIPQKFYPSFSSYWRQALSLKP